MNKTAAVSQTSLLISKNPEENKFKQKQRKNPYSVKKKHQGDHFPLLAAAGTSPLQCTSTVITPASLSPRRKKSSWIGFISSSC